MPDNTPQIASVTSESLQAKIRELLPSQQGFGHDLQASNVILPVIDLTATAEGSGLPTYLQTAYSFTDVTNYEASNTTTQIANSPGFWRVFGSVSYIAGNGARTFTIQMSDGLSTKTVWQIEQNNTGVNGVVGVVYDITLFLRAGDTASIVSNQADGTISAAVRQVADVNGVLINPTGYTPQ